MKPERIQIFFAQLVEGAKTVASGTWSVVRWIVAALKRLLFGCPDDRG